MVIKRQTDGWNCYVWLSETKLTRLRKRTNIFLCLVETQMREQDGGYKKNQLRRWWEEKKERQTKAHRLYSKICCAWKYELEQLCVSFQLHCKMDYTLWAISLYVEEHHAQGAWQGKIRCTKTIIHIFTCNYIEVKSLCQTDEMISEFRHYWNYLLLATKNLIFRAISENLGIISTTELQ